MQAYEIKSLMEEASRGPWERRPKKPAHVYSISQKPGTEHEKSSGYSVVHEAIWNKADADFIAALPDIASTALAALERVEELEKENKKIRLVNDEIQRREWLKFIRFVRRHKENATVAKDLLYHYEMESAESNCMNWYRNVYGETLEDDLKQLAGEETL